MASKPKRRMKYPPGSAKKTLQEYVKESVLIVKDQEKWWLDVKLANHSAMDNLVRGEGNPESLNQIVIAFNMVRGFILFKSEGEHIEELLKVQEAILSLVERVQNSGSFTLKSTEIIAFKDLVVLHDIYIENASVLEVRQVMDKSREEERNGDYKRLSLNRK